SSQVECSCDLVPELIRDDRLRPLVFRELVGIAAKTLLDADLHHAGRQQLLKARQADLARSEAVTSYERRSLGIGYRKACLLQRLAVEHAEVSTHRRPGPFTRAEAVFAANVYAEPTF